MYGIETRFDPCAKIAGPVGVHKSSERNPNSFCWIKAPISLIMAGCPGSVGSFNRIAQSHGKFRVGQVLGNSLNGRRKNNIRVAEIYNSFFLASIPEIELLTIRTDGKGICRVLQYHRHSKHETLGYLHIQS